MAMKRMTYLCRIGRNSLGLPRQAKADMSIKTAQLPALCLLNQYGIKKLSTVSDNKSKKCLVKSGKDTIWYEPFFTVGKIFFPSSLIFFPILKKVFVTNFVTCITNFVTRISKFVTSVTKFVIKIVCADNEKLQGERKNFQGERKKLLGATKTHKEDNLHGNSGADFHTYEKT